MIDKAVSITFLTTPTDAQARDINSLYRREGWWTDEPDDYHMIGRIVAGSHCFVIAESNGSIIGMGRAISDGASDAYIQDVTVKENFRRQGIGRRIIRMLIERLHEDNLHWIALIAEKGSHPFYERLGFVKMINSQPLIFASHAF